MEKYSPVKKELSTRDVVARANYMEILAGRGTKRGGVYLDISGKDKKFYEERLPKMYKMLKKYNKIDIAKEPMEIAPTAHYTMGGILVNPKTGDTGIENLYAVGEAMVGVHGANRLGGNSLAEILVFGDVFAEELLKKKIKKEPNDDIQKLSQDYLKERFKKPGTLDANKIIAQIRDIMWETAGIVRKESRLKKGIKKIAALQQEIEKKDLRQTKQTIEDVILYNRAHTMLNLAEAILRGALERRESRGAHYREDFKKKDDEKYHKNFFFRKVGNKITMTTKPIPAPSKKFKEFLEEFEKTVNYGHVE